MHFSTARALKSDNKFTKERSCCCCSTKDTHWNIVKADFNSEYVDIGCRMQSRQKAHSWYKMLHLSQVRQRVGVSELPIMQITKFTLCTTGGRAEGWAMTMAWFATVAFAVCEATIWFEETGILLFRRPFSGWEWVSALGIRKKSAFACLTSVIASLLPFPSRDFVRFGLDSYTLQNLYFSSGVLHCSSSLLWWWRGAACSTGVVCSIDTKSIFGHGRSWCFGQLWSHSGQCEILRTGNRKLLLF